MIEIYWGNPLHFVVTTEGDTQKFSTIEQARFWLRRKWPVADDARDIALARIQDAMDCLGSVGTARHAFIQAATAAGFRNQSLAIWPKFDNRDIIGILLILTDEFFVIIGNKMSRGVVTIWETMTAK